jgi:hypothetical protein
MNKIAKNLIESCRTVLNDANGAIDIINNFCFLFHRLIRTLLNFAMLLNNKQAQKRPKVFCCALIISLLNAEQNHLTQLIAKS